MVRLSVGPYIGGKYYIADWILDHLKPFHGPQYNKLVDVFGGAGSISVRAIERSIKCPVIYNDKWDDIYHLFKMIRSPETCERLVKYLKNTPYARKSYQDFYKMYQTRSFADDIERAAMIHFLLNVSKSGKILAGYATEGESSKNRHNAYRIRVDNLFKLRNILRNIQIENRDFREIIAQFDFDSTVFYVDPPYFNTENYYEVSFSIRDHWELAKLLNQSKALIMLSYYDTPDVEQLYPRERWTYYEKAVPKHSRVLRGVDGSKKDMVIEYLLMNRKTPQQPKQRSLMDFIPKQ